MIAKGMVLLEESMRTSSSEINRDSELERTAQRHKPLPRI